MQGEKLNFLNMHTIQLLHIKEIKFCKVILAFKFPVRRFVHIQWERKNRKIDDYVIRKNVIYVPEMEKPIIVMQLELV